MDELINIALAILMFSIGLNIQLEEFQKQLRNPLPIVIGLILQLTLPLVVAIVLITIFGFSELIAFGIVLVAAVPGGTTSAVITYWAKGDTALSVSLTAINSIVVSFITLPIIMSLCYSFFLSEELQKSISIRDIVLTLLVTIVVPIVLALVLKTAWPSFVRRVKVYFEAYMVIYYVVIVIVGILILADQEKVLTHEMGYLVLASFISNTILLYVGYKAASPFNFEIEVRKTIAIETAFQNNNLAMAVAIGVLHINEISIPALINGVVMTLVGIILIFFIRKNKN